MYTSRQLTYLNTVLKPQLKQFILMDVSFVLLRHPLSHGPIYNTKRSVAIVRTLMFTLPTMLFMAKGV